MVGLAGLGGRDVGAGRVNDPDRHLAQVSHRPAGLRQVSASLDDDRQRPIDLRTRRGHPRCPQMALDLVEVEPQAEHLGEPAAPSDHLDQPAREDEAEVTRAQLGELGPAGQVGRRARVAHHHVGSAVDDFAGRRVEP
jgi:hypothetical protein